MLSSIEGLCRHRVYGGVLLVFVACPATPRRVPVNLVNDRWLPAQRPGLHLDFDGCCHVLLRWCGNDFSLSAAEAKDPARSVATSMKAMIWRLSHLLRGVYGNYSVPGALADRRAELGADRVAVRARLL